MGTCRGRVLKGRGLEETDREKIWVRVERNKNKAWVQIAKSLKVYAASRRERIEGVLQRKITVGAERSKLRGP